jgi:hypothetical protein
VRTATGGNADRIRVRINCLISLTAVHPALDRPLVELTYAEIRSAPRDRLYLPQVISQGSSDSAII